MRVAHVNYGGRPEPARSVAVRPQVHPPRIGHSMPKRNGAPFEARRAHVAAKGPGPKPLARDNAGLSLDFDGADPELAAKPIGHATRAVAARASECTVVVIDKRVGRGTRCFRIAEHHHLIVAETRRAMDGARILGRRTHGRTPQVEHEDSVAGAVHTRDRAAGERMAGEQALPSL